MHQYQPEPIQRSRQFQNGHSLLSLIPQYKEDELSPQESININELNISDLFSHYYLEKYPDNQEVPTDIKIEFQKLLEENQSEIS